MRCRAAEQAILRSVDRELDLETGFVLERHLAGCPACEAFRRRQQVLDDAFLRAARPATARLDVEGALVAVRAALARAPPPCARRVRRRRRAAKLALAAATLAAAFVAVRAWDPPAAAPPVPASAPTVALPASPAPERGADVEAPAPSDAPPADPAAVRAAVRAHLRAAFARADLRSDAGPAVERFETLAGGLLRERWPLPVYAADLLADADPGVASAAARYLGRRGGAVQVSALKGALARPDVAPAAVLALADLGALAALEPALRDPDLAPLALARVQAAGGPEAARVVEEALERSSQGAESTTGAVIEPERLLAALAAIGTPAVEALLRVGARDDRLRGRALVLLTTIDGAPAELARILADGARGYPRELLLDAAVRLPSDRALAWTEELCRSYEHKDVALAHLVQWRGERPWHALLRLSKEGFLPEEELGEIVGRLVAHSPAVVARLSERLVAERDVFAAGELLDLLLSGQARGSGGALVTLAVADVLPRDERQWAALAVAELGDDRDAEELARRIGGFAPEDRLIVAASLLSVRARLGEQAVGLALRDARASERGIDRVLDALASVDGHGAAGLGLHRIARAVDGALAAKNLKNRLSSS